MIGFVEDAQLSKHASKLQFRMMAKSIGQSKARQRQQAPRLESLKVVVSIICPVEIEFTSTGW